MIFLMPIPGHFHICNYYFLAGTAALAAGLASSFLASTLQVLSLAGSHFAGAAAGAAGAGLAAGAWAKAVAAATAAMIAISCFMIFSLRLETFVQNYSVQVYLMRDHASVDFYSVF